MNQVLSIPLDEIRARAGTESRIVFLSGDFNVIHPGHLRIINFAAECGDFLVVGVNADGRGNTLVPESVRCDAVRALSAVGYAFILTEPVDDFIRRLQPATVVKGAEYRAQKNVEKPAVESYGGKLLFCSGDAHYSYIDLLRRQLEQANVPSLNKSDGYLSRHGFGQSDLSDIVRRFTGLRLAVIGDLIVDEYIDCDPLGMSREDPTLVVSPILSKQFVGGAGIVAAHARALGADVTYFGVVGDDPAARYAEETLQNYGVNCVLAVDDTRPTTLKQRYRAEGKTLLRVSHLRQHTIGEDLIREIAEQVEEALKNADLLIFSDFNYGCLPQPLVNRLINVCSNQLIPMVADSQASSQMGDISRFKGMMLITPTEHEARLAMQDAESGLVVLAQSLRKKAVARHVVVTLASEGIFIHSPDGAGELSDDRLPAFNPAPHDVSGAGDCLLVTTAMALATGADIWRSTYLGSIAAGCQVGRIGNLPLDAAELMMKIKR